MSSLLVRSYLSVGEQILNLAHRAGYAQPLVDSLDDERYEVRMHRQLETASRTPLAATPSTGLHLPPFVVY
jgi:hypothetical protein